MSDHDAKGKIDDGSVCPESMNGEHCGHYYYDWAPDVPGEPHPGHNGPHCCYCDKDREYRYKTPEWLTARLAERASVPVLETPPPQKFQECDEDGLPSIEAICAALNRHADYMEAGNNAELAEVYDAAQEMIFRGAPVEPVPAPTAVLEATIREAHQRLTGAVPFTFSIRHGCGYPTDSIDKVTSLLGNVLRLLKSAPVPAPRLECDHTTEFYDEAGDSTRVLWSEDVIGYNYCPDCGTLLSAPPVGTQE